MPPNNNNKSKMKDDRNVETRSSATAERPRDALC